MAQLRILADEVLSGNISELPNLIMEVLKMIGNAVGPALTFIVNYAIIPAFNFVYLASLKIMPLFIIMQLMTVCDKKREIRIATKHIKKGRYDTYYPKETCESILANTDVNSSRKALAVMVVIQIILIVIHGVQNGWLLQMIR